MIKTVLTCAGIVFSLQCTAQNIIPLGTLPMQYNSGFAGESEKARLITGGSIGAYSFAGRNYWNNYFASYDQFFPELRSGIGLTVNGSNHDYYYNRTHYDTRESLLQLSFSPKFSVRGKYTLAPFVDLSYHEYKHPTYYSMGNILTGDATSGRVGILFNMRKFYFGLTYYAFSTGSYARILLFNSNSGKHPWVLQTAYAFQRMAESKFSFTPHLAFFFIAPVYELSFDLNLMFRYKKFIWSLNNTGLGLGYQNKNFRILLTQNFIYFTRSNLQSSISLRYFLR